VLTTSLFLAASFVAGQVPESPVYEHLKGLEAFIGTWEAETVVPVFCSRRTLSIAYVLEFSTSRQEKLDVEANAFYA
jgi:hypothetical protein